MAKCDELIKRDIGPNCEDPLVGGYEAEGVIINRRDIDWGAVEFEDGSNNVITNLPLKTGKRGYEIVQENDAFSGSNKTLAVGTNRNGFTHNVNILIPDAGPEVSQDIIDPMGTNSDGFVVIRRNKYKGLISQEGKNTFEVSGFFKGLKASAADQDPYSQDTDGAWSFTLTEERAPRSAMYLWAGSYEATEALIETILVAGNGTP